MRRSVLALELALVPLVKVLVLVLLGERSCSLIVELVGQSAHREGRREVRGRRGRRQRGLELEMVHVARHQSASSLCGLVRVFHIMKA